VCATECTVRFVVRYVGREHRRALCINLGHSVAITSVTFEEAATDTGRFVIGYEQ